MILVDTTVWIDFFNNRNTPEKRAFEKLVQDGELLCVTDIILTEILRGVRGDREVAQLWAHLEHFPCLTARAPKTFLFAAELYRRCRAKGITIRSTVDCLIAAVCLENNVSLLHHDADFVGLAKCCGLRLVDPRGILKA